MDERRMQLFRTCGPPVAAIAAILTATAGPVAAQEPPNPLRFLRPWLEQQLGVPEAPANPAPTEQTETPGPGSAAPEAPAFGLDDAPPGSRAEPGERPEMPGQPGSAVAAPNPPAGPPPPEAGQTAAPPEPGGGSEGPLPIRPAMGPDAPAPVPGPLPGPGQDLPATAGVPQQAEAAAEEGPQPLRLGVLAGRDVMATMAAIEPISRDLTQMLGRPVEILPLSSYAAMIDAQAQRRIDGGFYSAAAFASAEANCRCLEPIAAPAAADGTLAYYAIIVTRANSGLTTVADLQGRTVAVGARDSIGARRMQLAGLLEEGADPERFAAVAEVESAEEAVRLVVSGANDAAFAWSSMEGNQQAGYSRGTLADLVARGEVAMSEIAVIWRSAAVPHAPFAVLKSLPTEDKAKLESYLLRIETSAPAAYDMLNPYYSGGYRAVEPADYAGLEVLTAQNVDAIKLRIAPRISVIEPIE